LTRNIALLLTVATGTAGLVYEVTWQHMLAVLLGSHAEATAAVLAFFLGGLAIGYSLFGRLSLRIGGTHADGARRLLLAYGAVEAGIGFYALAFPYLFRLAQAVSPLGPSQPGLAFAWDAMLASALILPGTILMGATVPFLTQALPKDVDDATRVHAAIYGTNTLGAFVGALSASFLLIPEFGLTGTLRVMAMVNLVAGIAFVLLAQSRSSAQAATAPVSSARPLRLGSYAAAALLLGAAMMTLQTAVIRVGALSLGASLYTFAMVVAVFVLCIAIGSLAVGSLERVPSVLLPVVTWLLFAYFLLLYPLLEDAPYYAHVVRSFFRDVREGFVPFQFAVLLTLLFTIGPAVALSGATLPLLFDRLRREHGELGDAAGRLYGWNTAGSLIGALFGGYALFYWLDLHQVYRLAVAAIAVAAALLTPLARLRVPLLQPALAVPALIALLLLPAWSPRHLATGAFRARAPVSATFLGPDTFVERQWGDSQFVFADDDPTANIVVTEQPGELNGARAIRTNGKSDGSVAGDYTTFALTGLLPAWLATSAERAFVIGFGTGVTAGELAALDEVKQVTIAEISPAVAAAAPLFDASNQGTMKSPKVEIVRGDAYRVLLRSKQQFELIVSEPSNPWVNGVEMLYSEEFLRAAKDHLAPGGVFCQWFHLYETDKQTIALVLRTYDKVFDHVAIWYGLGIDLFLIAFDDPVRSLDLPRLQQRYELPDFRAGFERAGATTFTEVLAHELWPVGVLEALEMEGPLHTLMHPRLSHTAARAFFVGNSGRLPVSVNAPVARIGAENSLIRRFAKGKGGLTDAERRGLVAETCRLRSNECVALLAQWHVEDPGSSELAALEKKIREHPDFSRQVPLRAVNSLTHFYGKPDGARDGDGVSFAKQDANRFVSYYHHAAPFQRSALRDAFRGCENDPEKAEECVRSRKEAERILGPLDDDQG
jgi:predicted membrane-bound spermidine synthase